MFYNETDPFYQKFLDQRADCLHECAVFLNDACEPITNLHKAGRFGELAISTLTRNVIENVEGISVLIRGGSILPCFSLLRTVFESWLGVQYVIQTDTENRGREYFVFFSKQQMSMIDYYDPTTKKGQDARKRLASDVHGQKVLDQYSATDLSKLRAEAQADLDDPCFSSLAATTKKHDHWYGMGLADLCTKLGFFSHYVLYYKLWCQHVHGADAQSRITVDDDPSVDAIYIRPIKHPGDIHTAFDGTGKMSIILAGKLSGKFGLAFDEGRYRELEQRINRLANEKIHWRPGTSRNWMMGD